MKYPEQDLLPTVALMKASFKMTIKTHLNFSIVIVAANFFILSANALTPATIQKANILVGDKDKIIKYRYNSAVEACKNKGMELPSINDLIKFAEGNGAEVQVIGDFKSLSMAKISELESTLKSRQIIVAVDVNNPIEHKYPESGYWIIYDFSKYELKDSEIANLPRNHTNDNFVMTRRIPQPFLPSFDAFYLFDIITGNLVMSRALNTPYDPAFETSVVCVEKMLR